MISKRIIPLFLLKGTRLVKGTNFGDFTDVGDPTSQGMIYDAQGAEEIIIVDVEASSKRRTIDTKIINDMITKCRIPIGAGGGIKNVEDAIKCFEAGADKIVVNTHAVLRPALVKELANEFGSQSVVVSIDVKKNKTGDYEIYIFSGNQRAGISLEHYIEQVVDYGSGEIIITSMDKEGRLSGLDYELYAKLKEVIPVPFIASGGAGCYDDIVKLFNETDCDACALGKMLFLRDYDIVRIKAYLKGEGVWIRDS